MSVWDVRGQERAVTSLRGAVARGDVGHAWAFLGPRDVGQERSARALAAALNCPTPAAPGEPCGRCDVCGRCLRGTFAAYREFTPTGQMHRVEEVREDWLPVAATTSLEGSWKVLRVCAADRMNDAAANAFLKALEEPPERTVWVLDLADPDEVPETILSRCRALTFAAITPADLDEEARELGLADSADRALAVRLASGSPRALRRLCEEHGLDDVRAHREIPRRLREEGPGYALLAARAVEEEVKRRTAGVKEQGRDELEQLSQDYGQVLPASVAKQLDQRQRRRESDQRRLVVEAALDDLVAWYRDCLFVGAGGDPADALHLDATDELRADAAALGAPGILRAVDLVLATRESLERNLQQTLALEALFIQLSALTLTAVPTPR